MKNKSVVAVGIAAAFTIISTSAYAWGYSTSNVFGGQNFYSSTGGMTGYSTSNVFGGQNFYSSTGGMTGYSTPNVFGGYNYNGFRGAKGESTLFDDADVASKIDDGKIADALSSRNVDVLTSCAWDLKGLEMVLGKVDKKTSSKMLFAAAAQLAVEQGNADGLKAVVALAPDCKKYEDQLALKGKTRGVGTGSAYCLPEIVPLESKGWKERLKELKPWQAPMFNRDLVCCNFRGVSGGDAEACAAMINGGRATMNPLMEAVGALQLSKFAAVGDISAKLQPSSIFKEATEMAIYKGDTASMKQLASLYETSSFFEPDYMKYIRNMSELSGKTRGLTDGEFKDTCKEALLVLIGGLIAGALD